jgi:arginine decarboxylase
MEFKRAYDANAPLVQVLPALVDAHPYEYRAMGLKDLAAAMHAAMRITRVLECMDEAFTLLPDAVLSPHATYSQLVKRNVEKTPVSALLERIVAVQLVPYPPGIPIMMPGERVTAKKRAVVDYLLALEHFDSRFPGFEHDTHGIEVERDRDACDTMMANSEPKPMLPKRLVSLVAERVGFEPYLNQTGLDPASARWSVLAKAAQTRHLRGLDL